MAKSNTPQQETGADARPHILLLGGDGGYSGVPTYLEQLCCALQSQARFSVIADRNEGGYDFAKDGIVLHEVAGMKTGLSPRRIWRALRALNAQITAQAPDLVWAHARMSLIQLRLVMIWRALRKQPVPRFAVTYHGLPFGAGHRRIWGAISHVLETVFLRLAPPHQLHFLSEAAARSFNERLGPKAMARHRVHVLSNCSNLGPLVPRTQARAPTLLMTGRASYQKNHAAAAQLFAALPQDYELILCGDGTEAAKMAPMFEALQTGLSDRVQFLGPIANVGPVLAQADLFLLPSHYEGMPIAALEAFEAGLPMALSDIAGMAEILAPHPMAVAIDPNAAQTAAQAVVDLVSRFRRAPAARADIQAVWQDHFSYDVWRRGVQKMVWELLDQGPP